MKRALLTLLGLCLASQVWAAAATLDRDYVDKACVVFEISCTAAAASQIDTLSVHSSSIGWPMSVSGTNASPIFAVSSVQDSGDSITVATDWSIDGVVWSALEGSIELGGNELEWVDGSNEYPRFLRFRIVNTDVDEHDYSLTVVFPRGFK